MPNAIARYGDPRRYLVKALREIGHRIHQIVAELDEHTLIERPDGEEWCIKEVVGYLRDAEREDLRAIQQMSTYDGAPIEERRAHFGPAEHDYRREPIEELLWEFATLREETLWALRTAGPAWSHCGQHPYRGAVEMLDWVREINERDLDVMWRIQRLRNTIEDAERERREARSS